MIAKLVAALKRAAGRTPVDAADVDFRPGQVWRYRTRPTESESTLTVLKVERHENIGAVVHVAVGGLRVRNPHHASGVSETISHMPFALGAVHESVTERVREDAPLPDHADGYAQWRSAFDAGEGGVFTIPVAEAVEYMERAINA